MKRFGLAVTALLFVVVGCGDNSTESTPAATQADEEQLALAELTFEVHQAPG